MKIEGVGTDRLEGLGERFVTALAGRDFEGLRATMTDDIRFRLLLPGGPQTHLGAAETVDRFVGWFAGAEEVRLESSTVGTLGGRLVLTFRCQVQVADGRQVIEQHLMADVAPEGRLETIDLLCSGFLPDPDPSPNGIHRFDAGNLGCADGLAGEFRRRVQAIPVGDVLVVTARDPAAKEDLPPLARMMGHAVRSIEAPGDGRLLFTVERRR